MSVNGDVQSNQSCVFWWIFRSLFSSKLFRDAFPGKRWDGGFLQSFKLGEGLLWIEIMEKGKYTREMAHDFFKT